MALLLLMVIHVNEKKVTENSNKDTYAVYNNLHLTIIAVSTF